MTKRKTAKRRQPIKAHKRAKVDIIIPVYGSGRFLLECLQSLFEHDAGVVYNLILVDDAGPEDPDVATAYNLASEHGARVIFNKKNLGFAGTNNVGARVSKAPWILLLNSDILVTHDGWLKAMVDEGERDPRVGVVGALLTFFPFEDTWCPASPIRPPGAVQHAGVVFDIMRRPYHIFHGWPADHPKVAQRRYMNCVTGACLLTRRKLWRRLGGLDTDYGAGNFEDVQYCVQTRLSGFKVAWTPKAHLHHYAGGSGNSETAQRNASLFQFKMGEAVMWDEWLFWGPEKYQGQFNKT